VRILEEQRALVAAGHDVAVATYGNGDDVPGVEIVRTMNVPWYQKLTAGASWHKFYLDVFLFFTALLFARHFRPAVIHAHLHEGVFIAALMARLLGGIPVVGDLQGSLTGEMSDHGFFKRWQWGKRIFAKLETWINRAPREIVVSAEPLVEAVRASRPDSPRSVSFLGDGVNATEFRPDPAARARSRAALGFGDDDLVFAYLGLLTEYQGVEILLEAAREVVAALPHARFLVMGFPNEDAYREQVRALGLEDRVHLTGRVLYEHAAEMLTAADVAVSPKLSPTEGNGKLLNYMAVGIPTVAFDTPVNRSILGELGVWAKLGDPSDLARALIEIGRDGARRRSLATALRRRAVEEFSWGTRAGRFSEIYRRITKSAKTPGLAQVSESQRGQ
jgi:glycosyltransferase involved in cell wall biosynthesis